MKGSSFIFQSMRIDGFAFFTQSEEVRLGITAISSGSTQACLLKLSFSLLNNLLMTFVQKDQANTLFAAIGDRLAQTENHWENIRTLETIGTNLIIQNIGLCIKSEHTSYIEVEGFFSVKSEKNFKA